MAKSFDKLIKILDSDILVGQFKEASMEYKIKILEELNARGLRQSTGASKRRGRKINATITPSTTSSKFS